MAPLSQPETEQKYDADPATPLPELLDIPGVERIAEQRTAAAQNALNIRLSE